MERRQIRCKHLKNDCTFGQKHDETSIVTGNPSEKSRWYRAYLSTLGNRGAFIVLNDKRCPNSERKACQKEPSPLTRQKGENL
jgi:hypothetical protein